jgi:superfamily I DNA/RNA helicase
VLDLHTLNPQQRQAVETLRGPVLILAGAGTGKTRVITFRIAHLIRKGIAPDHILAVTFTNKAAREMQERVRTLLPKSRAYHAPRNADDATRNTPHPSRPTICTFHSLCVRILRQHIHRLGYKRNFVIYDESDQLSTMKRVLAQIASRADKVDPADVLALLSRSKNNPASQAFNPQDKVAAMLDHVRERYASALKACNAVDFDDLILLTLRVFREHPDALETCRERYQYVMVDEYQDTNGAQFELVHALTSQHRNLCVVGDDDQSIYGWRGAEIAHLLDMEKHYPEVKVIKLEQNYRSTTTILDAANAIIRHNVRRRGKTLWSAKGRGEPITFQTFDTDTHEAEGIVEEIEFQRMARRVPWGSQAILFRTNQQSRPLETALRQARIRYRVVGGQSFFDRREIRDLLAYLKLFLNPHDDASLLRIANVPARGLSDATLQKLLAESQAHHHSVFSTMTDPTVVAALAARARECIEEFVGFVNRTRAALHEPGPADHPTALQDWAARFLDEIGYFNELRRIEKDTENAESRVMNLKDLIADLDGDRFAGQTPQERLERFLEDVVLDAERDEEEDTKTDQVTLITMHSCKGLEFPHVYVVGLEEGLLPHSRSKEENTLDEERRLFYVAVTRAQECLTLSHCRSRKQYGQPVHGHPSQFLQHIPEDLVQHASEREAKPVSIESGKSMFAALRQSLG